MWEFEDRIRSFQQQTGENNHMEKAKTDLQLQDFHILMVVVLACLTRSGVSFLKRDFPNLNTRIKSLGSKNIRLFRNNQ